MSRSSLQVCWRQFAWLGLGGSLFTNPPKEHAGPLPELAMSAVGLQSIKKASQAQISPGSLSVALSRLSTDRRFALSTRKVRSVAGLTFGDGTVHVIPLNPSISASPTLCCTDQHPGAVRPPQRHLREANVLRPPKLDHPV